MLRQLAACRHLWCLHSARRQTWHRNEIASLLGGNPRGPYAPSRERARFSSEFISALLVHHSEPAHHCSPAPDRAQLQIRSTSLTWIWVSIGRKQNNGLRK